MAKPRLRPYPQQGTITIADGVEHHIERGGNFLRVRSADSSFTIRLDDDVELKAEQNDVYRLSEGDAFNKIVVINDTGGNLTFQLEIGQGTVETNNVSISGNIRVINGDSPNQILDVKAENTSPVNVKSAGQDFTTAQVAMSDTATIIRSSNSDRTAIHLKNIGGSTVYIGSNTGVSTSNGYPLSPGQELNIETQDSVTGICATGQTSTIATLYVFHP
jgi:hypothetical protein